MDQKPKIDATSPPPVQTQAPKRFLELTRSLLNVPNRGIVRIFLISSFATFSSGIAFAFEWTFHGKNHKGFQWIIFYALSLIFLPLLIWLGLGIVVSVSFKQGSVQVTSSVVEMDVSTDKSGNEEAHDDNCRSLAVVIDPSTNKKCTEKLFDDKPSKLKRTVSFPLRSQVKSCRTSPFQSKHINKDSSSMGEELDERYSSNKVADIDTELFKMKASLESKEFEVVSLRAVLLEKDVLLKNLQESEKKLLDSLDESKVEIASLKERVDGSYHSQDSSEEDEEEEEEDDSSDIESIKESLAQAHEVAQASSLKISDLLEEITSVKNELKSATDAEMTSKKAMDDLALALKEVATDCSQTKEKLEASRLECREWKEKHEEARKEAELLKNTSQRLRIEAEESLLAWNGKESVFVSCIKKGEDEKNSLLDENNRLLEALVGAENLSKKAKEENHKVRDILKQAISEANVAKEAAVIARAENSNLKDALLDKEEELQFALSEIERVKANEAVANENVKKLKKLLFEVEVATEEEKHRSLSRQESMQKEVEVEKKKRESKKEKKEQSEKKEEKEKRELTQQNIDKKMIGKTCSFSLMKLAHNHNHKHKESVEEETKASHANANTGNHQDNNVDDSGEGNSPGSDSDLFKGSIFDVAETPHAANAQTHHRRRSSLTFLEDVETINPEDLENLDGNHLDEGELNDKGGVAARKKKAFIRRFGDLLVRRKSLSFSHKKESSTDSQDKQQQPPTPTSPSPPQPPLSPEH